MILTSEEIALVRAEIIDAKWWLGDLREQIDALCNMALQALPQEPLPPQMFEALDITEEAVAAQVESEALALLRELNDALAIPERFQPRVDAVLDRAEEKT